VKSNEIRNKLVEAVRAIFPDRIWCSVATTEKDGQEIYADFDRIIVCKVRTDESSETIKAEPISLLAGKGGTREDSLKGRGG